MSKPSESDIAKHAYQLWEREGRPQGRDKDHWHAAEREILGAATTQEEPPIGETRNAQHADTRQVEPPPSSRQTGGAASPGRPAQPASPAGTQAAAAPGKRAPQVQSEQAAGAKQQQSGAKNSASPPARKPRGSVKQSDT